MLRLPIMLVVLLIAACGGTPQAADTLATPTTGAAAGYSVSPTPTTEPVAPTEAMPQGDTMTEPTTESTQEAQVRKQYTSPPEMQIDPNKSYTATIQTSKGTIVAELFAKEAPITVNNFVTLARDGYYNGIIFHRVIPDFVIQGGDPTGTGMGGPGYQFQDEPVRRPYEEGSLAMANSGPNTNGSQFFIVTGSGYNKLQPLYNHFGRVTQGQEVVDAIANVPTGPQDKPRTPVTIESVTIEEK